MGVSSVNSGKIICRQAGRVIVPIYAPEFFDRSFKYKSFFVVVLKAVRHDVNYLENAVVTVVQEIELVINRSK